MAERKSELLAVPVPKRVMEALDRVASASWTSRSEFGAVLKDLEHKGFAATHHEQLLAAMMTPCLTRPRNLLF